MAVCRGQWRPTGRGESARRQCVWRWTGDWNSPPKQRWTSTRRDVHSKRSALDRAHLARSKHSIASRRPRTRRTRLRLPGSPKSVSRSGAPRRRPLCRANSARFAISSNIAAIKKRQADITKRIADKTGQLHKEQQRLYKEQDRERKSLTESLTRRDTEMKRKLRTQCSANLCRAH